MSNKFLILFYFCSIALTCRGAIWKTEDSYIIDDLLEDDNNEPATTESSNVCVDKYGARGQCVPLAECNGQHKFLENEVHIPTGLQEYLNGTELELCEPANQDTSSATPTPIYYVCCTSLKYANVRSTTLEEYNAKYSNQILEEPLPEISNATASGSELYIVNGQEAARGEFPFAVAIIFRGRQLCGGSLIDSQWVLSAAHCFDKFNAQSVRQMTIKIGYHNIATTGAGQDISVSKLFLHPGFFRRMGYFNDDVALVKLRSPVSPGTYIRTIALHSGSPNINGRAVEATVSGWGKTCAGACSQSSVLRKTKLFLLGNPECSQRYTGTAAPPITQNMICAGGSGGMDSCNGDSGGPLVIYSGGQAYQIGIVSWGIGCGQYPGVYTRVSSFVNWIIKHKNKP